MPVYQYKCKKCKNEFEIHKSFELYNKKETCPACKSDKTIKVFSSPKIIFNGDGFYSTDYKKGA